MKVRKSDQRVIGLKRKNPWGAALPVYEYLCPDCGAWSAGSDITRENEDGTSSFLCPACAKEVEAELFPPTEEEAHQ